MTSNDIDTTEAHYLEVINAKTAALFAAACAHRRGGGRAPGGRGGGARGLRPQSRHRLPAGRRRARLFGAPGELGKTVGDDFREGKITLPVVLAFQAGGEDEREFWRRTLEDREPERGRPRPRHRTDAAPRHAWPRRWNGRGFMPGPRAARLACSTTCRSAARSTRRSISAWNAATEAESPQRPVAAKGGKRLYRARRSVAQPGRALASGARGRRFKSSHSDHFMVITRLIIGNPAETAAFQRAAVLPLDQND